MHTAQESFAVLLTPSSIGEKKKGVLVLFPIGTEVVKHCRWQGNHAVFVALAATNPKFADMAINIVNSERKALGKP